MPREFQEVAHAGGKITFSIVTDAQGRRGYQQSFSNSRPVPVVMIGVYALLQQGMPVCSVNIGVGIGNPFDPPPLPGCVLVMIASDSSGQFGHNCQACAGYWRSGPWPSFCPYCRRQDQPHEFLSDAQRRYVAHYCRSLGNALHTDEDNEYVIDMDAVADAAGKDNIVGQYAKQLHNLVPLSKRRSDRLERGRFHDLEETAEVLKWFDIDLLALIPAAEVDFLKRMFWRRHVYEHNGGEVDQSYIDKSGDASVRLKRHIFETVENLHRLLGALDRMVRNLHEGFHELLPPLEAPIKAQLEKRARMEAYRRGST